MSTLAHELIHALQDRELDLQFQSQSTDQDFAQKALIEGMPRSISACSSTMLLCRWAIISVAGPAGVFLDLA